MSEDQFLAAVFGTVVGIRFHPRNHSYFLDSEVLSAEVAFAFKVAQEATRVYREYVRGDR